MVKNLFKLNSSGNVRQKKHLTMQNTVFRSEMTMKKRKTDTSAFSSVCREFYKSCLKPHGAQVEEGKIIFILQMKKKKIRKLGCTQSYSEQIVSGYYC